MAVQIVTNDLFLDTAMNRFSSPDPELQRGRKRRRNPPEALRTSQLRSAESSTLRGRCRHRSTSRLDASRASSRARGGSISPSRRKFLRVIHRHRSQSPSRSRTPTSFFADGLLSSRRRQRTASHSRSHHDVTTTQDLASAVAVAVDKLVGGPHIVSAAGHSGGEGCGVIMPDSQQDSGGTQT